MVHDLPRNLTWMETAHSPIELLPDFAIEQAGPASSAFRGLGIGSFHEAAAYVHQLPYRRNANKADVTTVLSDGCGTCSTKHALLKVLADEHNVAGLELVLGIFKMSGGNTRGLVSDTLARVTLDYLPEAHNYLRWDGKVVDVTWPSVSVPQFMRVLMDEVVIGPEQITEFKVAYHKAFLERWLWNNPEIWLSMDELWVVREQCIRDLGG
jgi:hypothetical protein